MLDSALSEVGELGGERRRRETSAAETSLHSARPRFTLRAVRKLVWASQGPFFTLLTIVLRFRVNQAEPHAASPLPLTPFLSVLSSSPPPCSFLLASDICESSYHMWSEEDLTLHTHSQAVPGARPPRESWGVIPLRCPARLSPPFPPGPRLLPICKVPRPREDVAW